MEQDRCSTGGNHKPERRQAAVSTRRRGVGHSKVGPACCYMDLLLISMNLRSWAKGDLGLGKWIHTALWGDDSITTRMGCNYTPCHSGKKATRSSYQQHQRHLITKLKNRTCPRKRFKQDLTTQLNTWQHHFFTPGEEVKRAN